MACAARKLDHRSVVARVDRDAFGPARDAGIARRGDELAAARRLPKPPRERILATARAQSRIFMDLPDETRAGLLANVAPGDNSPALSVSELSGALKRTVEDAFGHVRVRGEISGFKRHGSGHCYFRLKDENACIDAVIWRGKRAALAFLPEDGAEVIATGKLTTYPGRSQVPDRRRADGDRRARARCSPCSRSAARRSPPKACSRLSASASCRSFRR